MKVLFFIIITFCIACSSDPTSSNKENNTPPKALFSISPKTGTPATFFTFNASACSDAEDSLEALHVRWDWENDGTWDTEYSLEKIVTHQYSEAGNWIIKMMVRDSEGLMDSVALQLIVGNEKSLKRGLAYDLRNPADLEVLQNGVSWWYNWYYSTSAPADYYQSYNMEFIPMLWGGNTSASDMTQVKNFIINHTEIDYLLVMNEPNLMDQANRTPTQAAADWLKYEQVISDLAAQGRTIYLVGPAITWGTMNNYWDPVVWLDAFYAAYRLANDGRDPLIDYLVFHWYDYGLESQLNRLQKYGKQIWITEMANWNANINSYQKMAQQMTDMVAICESRDDVFRYSWFIGRGAEDRYTNLFNPSPGELNDLGELYISLPH